MKPTDSVSAFSSFAMSNGLNLSNCAPRESLEQMFSFYQSIVPEGCDEPNGDMLLFQWGTYDWGAGSHFELNITRQFIEQAFEDDDGISQLSLTFKFLPTSDSTSLAEGTRWCDGPQSLSSCAILPFPRLRFSPSRTRRPLQWNSGIPMSSAESTDGGVFVPIFFT